MESNLNIDSGVLNEVLNSGIDLREYSQGIEQSLKSIEHEAIQDYIKEADNVANLHGQIQQCDDILSRMEDMLGGFQSNLGAISAEIQSLQDQSVQMNIKLKNRQSVRGELSQFVHEMAVPDALLHHIMDTPVSERAFLEQVHELMHKIQFCQEQSFKDAQAASDVADVLEKLKIKAISKIREFLLQKINQYKKPLTNYQVAQDTMLKFRFYFEFLVANERNVAQEIKTEYIDTAAKMFYSYFKTYSGRLMKLQHGDVATKEDVVGAVEQPAGRTSFLPTTTKRTKATVFTIGDRNGVLVTLEEPIIVPHAAAQSNQKFQLEALFRSMQFALVDNACREYLFLSDFFMLNGQPDSQADIFNQVLGKSIEVSLKCCNTAIADCHDSIALLLCIHVASRYQLLMLKRSVPVLEKYWNSLLEQMLWPRFQYTMQLHVDSVQKADPQAPGDTRPHYIVRRYAEFSAALVSINQALPDERVVRLLAKLQEPIESLIKKLSQDLKTKRDQLVFLINNYDMLLAVLSERTSEDSAETTKFSELLSSSSCEYVEEVLWPHFGTLMKLVRECENLIEHNQMDVLTRYSDQIPGIVRKFTSDWKSSLEQIHMEIMKSFSNFKNGTNILQKALTSVVQYYHRFQKVLSQPAFVNDSARHDLINIHHLMVEVKKYKPSF